MAKRLLPLLLALLIFAPAHAEREIRFGRDGEWIEPDAGFAYVVEDGCKHDGGRAALTITVRAPADAPFALALGDFVLMIEKTNAAYYADSAEQPGSGWQMDADGLSIPAGMTLTLDWTFAVDPDVDNYQLVYLNATEAFYATPVSFAQANPTYAPVPDPMPDHTPTIIRTICFSCNGSGRCKQCGGTGTVRMYGQTSECSACGPGGSCSICGGVGYYEHQY